MKNYLEHNDKVKYVDGLLAHSQQWQWFIDLIQDTFEITSINSWNEYENCNRHLQDVFDYFIKIQEVSDGFWSFSKIEFSELWEIAGFFLGKYTFVECSSKITTTYGKLMLFCTWITKLGNASQTPPTAHIYDIRILNQKNYFQLIDLQPYLAEEAALLDYANSIEISGFDEPINCLKDNLSETEHTFAKDFFLHNNDKLLNYNSISFQTVHAQPYAPWQEKYLLDMVRVNINGKELQPQFVSGNVITPDTSLWQLDCLTKMKVFFSHKTADFLIDTISFILHGTTLPKDTKLTHISLLLNALKVGETKSDIFHSSSFRVISLLFETRSLKDCVTESCYKSLLKELHTITDVLLIISLKENGFPITESQIKIANEYYQSKYKEINNIEEAYELTRYLSDCDNPISIDSVHLETVRAKFDHCVESTEGIIISSLFYKYMVFLLQVNERNQNTNKQWVHAEMIRIQALWQNEHFERQTKGMYTSSCEYKIPTVQIERFNKTAIANPIYFAHQCIPCSTQKIIEIMQCTSEYPLLHMVGKTILSRIFPNGEVKINLTRHDIDGILAKQIEDILKNNGYKFLNTLSVDNYLLDIHNQYTQYTQMMVSIFQKNEELYTIIQSESDINLLPYSDTPSLALLTQLFPILEIKIREFSSLFGIFPFKKSLNEFMQYNGPSSLLREILLMIYAEQNRFENVPDLLFVYNVMYNSNSFNVRNECVHGRDFLSGPSLRFAMTVTLFALYMIIFRINTIKENVSDILELPE